MFEKQQPDGLKSRWSYRGWAPSTDGFVVKNHGDCNCFPFQTTCKWYKWPKKLGWSGLHLHVLGWILQVYHWNATPKHPESHGRDPLWGTQVGSWKSDPHPNLGHHTIHIFMNVLVFYGKISIGKYLENPMNLSWDTQGIVSIQEDPPSTLEKE